MKPSRQLALRREALFELGSDAMRHVVGGSHECVTTKLTHGPTCEEACNLPSNPVNDCLYTPLCPIVISSPC